MAEFRGGRGRRKAKLAALALAPESNGRISAAWDAGGAGGRATTGAFSALDARVDDLGPNENSLAELGRSLSGKDRAARLPDPEDGPSE
jgi:hypothetical protein